jgi:hypothetical protein
LAKDTALFTPVSLPSSKNIAPYDFAIVFARMSLETTIVLDIAVAFLRVRSVESRSNPPSLARLRISSNDANLDFPFSNFLTGTMANIFNSKTLKLL